MSGRFCSAARSVFFIAQAEMLDPVPQGGEAQADFEFAREALLEFGQRQIGLLLDPVAQRLIVFFQARTPIAAAALGLEAAGGRLEFAVTLDAAFGEFEEPRGLRRTVPPRSGRDDALAQIGAVGSHPRTLPHNATN